MKKLVTLALVAILATACRRDVDIPLPAVFLTADEAFKALGSATGGKRYDAPGATYVPEIIIKVIQENASGAEADIVFLIDNTSSMSDDINQVKIGLDNIISKLPKSARIAAATYADNNYETDWYKLVDLSADFSPIRQFIKDISVAGGGDGPESVYDGIYETLSRVRWAQKKRIIIVIGDAPPQNGDRTKHTFEDVVNKCKQAGVEANLYPILIN